MFACACGGSAATRGSRRTRRPHAAHPGDDPAHGLPRPAGPARRPPGRLYIRRFLHVFKSRAHEDRRPKGKLLRHILRAAHVRRPALVPAACLPPPPTPFIFAVQAHLPHSHNTHVAGAPGWDLMAGRLCPEWLGRSPPAPIPSRPVPPPLTGLTFIVPLGPAGSGVSSFCYPSRA